MVNVLWDLLYNMDTLNKKVILPNFNLDGVKVKLMMPEDEGKGWTREYVDYLEQEYIRLCAISKYFTQETNIVPSKDVDIFWHQHILDTKNYIKDCDDYFGFYMHHFPYFGLRGGEDKSNLLKSFDNTSKIYERLFLEKIEFHGVKKTIKSPKFYLKDDGEISLTP